MKKIGVVIPVYNAEKSIEKSINSLLNQTFKDWLAIIINDGSTDNTVEIINKYKDDDRFYIFHFNQNKGRPYARQKGLDIVKEINLKYMCMLDADDWYFPDKLKYQFDIIENNNDLTLVSSAIGVTSKDGYLFKIIKPFQNFKELYFSDYRRFVKLPHASSIIRVAHIDKNLKYDDKLKLSQDQDFFRRLLINKNYAFDPKIQYIYNREDSFSIQKYRKSIHYNFLSFKNLKLGKKADTLHFMKNKIKYRIVWLLSLFNLQQIYMSNVGINPTHSELIEFKENQNKIN